MEKKFKLNFKLYYSAITKTILNNKHLYFNPKFHFAPNQNWINDPNGLFFLDGVYHLYFQYYPKDVVWGPMHWGHATSKDLIFWEEHPIALSPDEKGYIFSGSVVVDKNNTSGFCTKDSTAIIAIFTYHDAIAESKGQKTHQTQGLAYSLDGGYTFTKYSDNPIIENPGIKDFRDPKVIWNQTQKNWLMLLSTYNETLFYISNNLKDWKYQSSFGMDVGAHGGVWECPDMFPLQIENSQENMQETKWVLLQSLNPGGPNGGSGTQYFIGDFDGKTFRVDDDFSKEIEGNADSKAKWLDYGKDNYASVSWSNIPENDGRRLIIGWMSNWDYADKIPTKGFRGKMTLPRKLSLLKTNGSYKLISKPVQELNLYASKIIELNDIPLGGKFEVNINDHRLNNSILKIELNTTTKSIYTIRLFNDLGEHLDFGIDTIKDLYFIDRSNSGLVSFSKKFVNPVSRAPINEHSKSLDLTAIIDDGSIELFFNGGITVITEIFFNTEPFSKISVHNNSDTVSKIKLLEIHTINKGNNEHRNDIRAV